MKDAWAELAVQVLRDRGLADEALLDETAVAFIARLEAAGTVSRTQLVELLAAEFGLPVAHDLKVEDPVAMAALVSVETARAHHFLPLSRRDGMLTVAVADPLELEALDDLAHVSGLVVDARLADPDALEAAIAQLEEPGSTEAPAASAVETPREIATEPVSASPGKVEILDLGRVEESDAPIVRLVEKIIAEAIRQRASDIHLEPMESSFRVRFRVDGRLRKVEEPPKHLQAAIVSRLKLMAELSLAEKRRPQDGRIRVRTATRELDLRVSCLPSIFGETLVLRLLDKEGLRLGLPELGMFDDDRVRFERLITQPDGIFLVTGPTGSGKSTTLYSALSHLNRPDRKIITVEDPVEYQITGINQVAVRREVGMDFSTALRAMLRQAPNVIMVGEIRDRETAEIAINASLTGHMVFSTLHTNDAPSAVSRLVDLGAKPFLVAASLRGVLAQRLVRMNCPDCAAPYTPEAREVALLGYAAAEWGERTLQRGHGCERCAGTGFFRRKGIFEMFGVDEAMETLIYERASLVALRKQGRASGMRTMREDGLRKVLAGWTTLGEVLAVTVEEAAD